MLVIKQFGPVTYAMGTLQEILAGTGIAAKVRALPNDVAGCTLEMGADGLWTGASVGTLTQVQADALVASGVLATVKAHTPASVNGQQVTWGGAGVGDWEPILATTAVSALAAVNIAVIGQSNEYNSLKTWIPGSLGSTATPALYRFGGFADPPDGIFHSDRGGWWARVLYHISQNRRVNFGNFARGSASLLHDICGVVETWSANTKYNKRRSSAGWLDKGDKGSFIVKNGNLFCCTTGNFRYCYINAPIQAVVSVSPSIGGGPNDTVIVIGSLISGGSEPTWSAATVVGDTVADGGLVWELVEVGTSAYTAMPWAFNYAVPKKGFDPLGILSTVDDWFLAQKGTTKNVVFFAQGQADWPSSLAGAATAKSKWYDCLKVLRQWANYQGYILFAGVTCDNPSIASFSDGSRPITYIQQAVNQLITDNPVPVSSGLLKLGGDLFAALGSNPDTYPDTAGSIVPGAHLRSTAMIPASDEWIRAWDAASIT